MKKKFWIIIFFFALECSALAQKPAEKITPPKKIDYNAKTYRYNPSWKNKELYLETNLDEDGDKEIIITFMGSYKPEKENTNENPEPFKRKKKEIVIIEHQAFYQIYNKGMDGHYELAKTLTGMDQPGRIELIKLDDKHSNAIAIYSPGGENYIDLSIYLWQEGGYRLLFNHGGTQNIFIDSLNQPVSIIDKNTPEKNIISVWDTITTSFK